MAKPRIIGRVRRDGDRTMLIAPERGFVLSETAHAIIELCDGTRDECEIADILATRFSADRETILRDIATLLATLRSRALVEDVL